MIAAYNKKSPGWGILPGRVRWEYGISGHVTLRTGVNGPFRYSSDLQYGDTIFVHTDENIYEYIVREQNGS